MVRSSGVVSCLIAFFLGVLATQSVVADEAPWSQFRGPDGSGQTQQTGLPVNWTASDVTWRTELEGQGHSSVCLWDEQIFLTSARSADNGQVERYVVCLNRNDGQVIWRQTASLGPSEQLHKMNSFATPTCVCDGERVVAFFGAAESTVTTCRASHSGPATWAHFPARGVVPHRRSFLAIW